MYIHKQGHYTIIFYFADKVPQSSGLRTFLRGKYAAAKLYQSRELYTPKDALDIAVNPGDLVGIIQKKDPMGNTKRWFVDNGITQVNLGVYSGAKNKLNTCPFAL